MKPNPIQTALNYAKHYEGLANPSLAEVAKHFGVSRTKVYQMLDLIKQDKRSVKFFRIVKEAYSLLPK
jgi:predicted DNA-binding protein YlxM (UPF0122 family)